MNLGQPPLPTDPSHNEVADWVELVTLRRTKLTRGKLSTELSRNGSPPGMPADVWRELEERSKLGGMNWAFNISTDQISMRPGDTLLTAFFAALGLRQNIENDHRQLFEQCVSELVRSLVPDVIRIGHPRRHPVSSSFREAFADYAKLICEEVIREPPATDNDLKMDVVAWRAFDDDRGGYVNLVGQCATGADWEDKLEELNISVVEDHLNWTVSPIRFFATPHVVPRQKFRRASKRGGIILDRPRLLELSRHSQLESQTRDEIEDVVSNLY